MSEQLKATFEDIERQLQQALRLRPLLTAEWAANLPGEAGVYVLWEANHPLYVGETSSLRLRMSDLGRAVNHTFSRKIAKQFALSNSEPVALASILSTRYALSYLKVVFGRKEVEEYLILRWRATLINKPTRRLLYSSQYQWVQPASPVQEE
jgi:hypothetical protein